MTIILDPRAFEAGGDSSMPITLKVQNMSLELALKWILRLADLDFSLRNEAIFISNSQNLAGDVELKIYDVKGRLVKTLVDRDVVASHQRVTWNGTDDRGQPVVSGVYFARLVTGGEALTRKMVMLK